MASSLVFISKATPDSDTMAECRPFAQARDFRAKPGEKPKLCSALLNEDECRSLSGILSCGEWQLQKRIGAAIRLPDTMKRIDDEKLLSGAVRILKDVMLDETQQHSLRTVCAISLGSSGYNGLVEDMEKEVLKANTSVQSKLLALKALSLCRSDEAIEMLGMVAQYGDIDRLCFAAAKELLSIPLYPAQKITRQILSRPPDIYRRNPDFLAEFRELSKLTEGCHVPVN